jgi:hypothetical protein
MRAPSNGTTPGSSNSVTTLRGDGLAQRIRKWNAEERLDLAVKLWLGTTRLSHFTLPQIVILVPGVTKAAIYEATHLRRNGGNGVDNNLSLPDLATLATNSADAVEINRS